MPDDARPDYTLDEDAVTVAAKRFAGGNRVTRALRGLIRQAIGAYLEAAKPVGYLTAYREYHGGPLWISYDGEPFTLDQALDDVMDAVAELPGKELAILELRPWNGVRNA